MEKRAKTTHDETHTRTVTKAISWRVVATLTTMTIVFIITRESLITLGVGLFDVIAKITFYYLHERMWNRISWGKKKHPLSSLSVTRKIEPEDLEKVKSYLKDLGYID